MTHNPSLQGERVHRRGRRSRTPSRWCSILSVATAATNAGEAEVKKFCQFLADWEKQHLHALKRLYDSVHEDFFASGNFAPF